MDKAEYSVVRGEEARQLLENAMFAAAFDDTRKALLEALASLDNLRDERAIELHCMVRSLAKVKRCIEEHVTTGKLAAKSIEGSKRGLMQILKRA